jgi:hypothetical protein
MIMVLQHVGLYSPATRSQILPWPQLSEQQTTGGPGVVQM